MRSGCATAVLLIASACAAGPARPVAIDLAHDACASCRMIISSRATAAQIVAPGEEPRLFDDFACLRKGLADAAPPADAAIFVADHLTGDWLRVEEAVFTEVPGLHTPMNSGLIAHLSAAERDQDPVARDGRVVPLREVLGRVAP